MEKRDRPGLKITPPMIEAAWQTMPSPYERDERDREAIKRMLNAIFEAAGRPR